MVIPAPTGEQDRALQTWVAGVCQVVSAAAGAGKSTMLLHAVRRAPPDADVVILSYNKPLAAEMTRKLEELERAGFVQPGVRARAFTFHGLCTYLYGCLAADDTSLEDTLLRVQRGDLAPKVPFAPTHVCVDEVQDMRPLHHLLLELALPKDVIFLLCGDEEQLLYSFEDPPATVEYMQQPALFFRREAEWRFHRLSTSFRLTPPVAALVNRIAAQRDAAPLEAGNDAAAPPLPRVLTCSVWQWKTHVLPLIMEALRTSTAPSDIGIIARSVRNSQPLLSLVNALSSANVPMYIHGVDGADERVRQSKICVSTWHASKGLEYGTNIVLGAEGTSEERPLHVAMTRASRRLVVVNDLKSPNKSLLRAIRDGVACEVDEKTRALAGRVDGLPEPTPFTPAGGARDVTGLVPRGAAAHRLHALIEDAGGVPPGVTELPGEIVVQVAGGWEDVTALYVDAALMGVETRRSGRCQRVLEMSAPTRATRAERIARLLEGDRTRLVDTRLDTRSESNDLLPTRAWRALHDMALSGSDAHLDRELLCARCCAAATATAAFNGFHHRTDRLLVSRWADADLFTQLCAVAHDALDPVVQFDAVVARKPPADADEEDRPMYARVHARSECARGECARVFHVVYADRLTAADRIRAVTPLALDGTLDLAVLINIRTGEQQRLTIHDRSRFLAEFRA